MSKVQLANALPCFALMRLPAVAVVVFLPVLSLTQGGSGGVLMLLGYGG